MACRTIVIVFFLLNALTATAQPMDGVTITKVDSGWAGNSVNTVVFRKNSLVTHSDWQFISFYNKNGNVVLGKRKTGTSEWQLKETAFTGNIKDAHNSISIMIDGEGYLHLAWDHHNGQLNYSISEQPLSLEMGAKRSMTGKNENSVSYPEFYKMPGGDLLFLYRDGGSGRGNLVVNKYSIATKQWIQLSDNLIDGEGKRNAYWQACVGDKNVIHLSWVWRESPDVASNHDLCYARSKDGGLTWENSRGKKYQLPINAATAEYAWRIPQSSELINQTSMYADKSSNPIIASYWKKDDQSVPQYHIVYKKNRQWQMQNLGFRTLDFSLSGTGTRQIPISRPQVITWKKRKHVATALIFRDAERNNKVSVAINTSIYKRNEWKLFDLADDNTGAWEPTYDTELWRKTQRINLFVQHVKQADAEGIINTAPQMVKVLEWAPF
ncbi:BNR repeat-containing protein [Terrimonas pollutisoli]|uniref:BNR repeat-containing protein n=1 Tax=Terrimonas pollutisoli TaxID=3034147 RepID=UPI0023EAB4EE|nr:BNR repeat-containing protein [Terrimonas sp. H1YJ31]